METIPKHDDQTPVSRSASQPPSPNNSPAPSATLWWQAGITLLYLFFALAALTNSTADLDLWGYLAFGRLFWKTGQFPYHDVFAYLPTLQRWIYHEWLTGVLFYPVYQALGGPGLQVFRYVSAFATLGLLYLTARRRGASHLGSLLGLFIITGFLVEAYSPVRANTFTYAFFALSLYLLERCRLSGNWHGLTALLPLQILWANLHGGFLAGLGLIFIYAAGEALSRRSFLPYLGVLALSGLATLVNPYGLDYWRYLWVAISMPRPEITEWASFWRAYQAGGEYLREFLYFFIIIAIALFIALRTRWRELTPMLALGVTLYLGLAHQRHQSFFFLLLGAYLPVPLTAYLRSAASDVGLSNLRERWGWKILVAGLSLLILLLGYRVARQNPLSLNVPPQPEMMTRSRIYYPVGAVRYLKQQRLSGSLLTEFNWGEYLIWVLFPRCKVSLDGRYETVYPETVCREYFDFIDGRPAWRQFLDKYPPDMILVDSRGSISSLLRKEETWRQVYQDSGCALFLRADYPSRRRDN